MKQTFSFELNGRPLTVSCEPQRRLIDLLRDDLGLTGAKIGCGEGECGACTVLVNDKPLLACIMAAGMVRGQKVLTIEGLRQRPGFSILAQAFNDVGAVQCGFCTPGMIMSAYALLSRHRTPTPAQIQQAISGNLCRCTGYNMIVEAVILAQKYREEDW